MQSRGCSDDIPTSSFDIGIRVLGIKGTSGFVNADGGIADDVRVDVILDFLRQGEKGDKSIVIPMNMLF